MGLHPALHLRTHPGSLSAVDPLVLDETEAQAEGTAALGAGKGLLARVDPLVPEES